MSRKLALIIGNTEYQDPALRQLITPGADASELAVVLRASNIGAFDEVITLINESSTTVRLEIESFFAEKKLDDLLVLYFSGHGVRDDQGLLYLAVKDTRHNRLRATAIPAAFIRDGMDNSRSRRQVLVLDCCHSGAFAQGTKGITGESVGTKTAFEGLGFGRVVLTATDATQYAWEGDQVIGQAENSVFTHFMIEGLKTGAADTNGDGLITLDELYDYVYEQVVVKTPRQTPGKWSYKQQGELVLAKNPRPIVPKSAALPVALREMAESPVAGAREAAVNELGMLLNSSVPGVTQAAQDALRRLQRDESRPVALAATSALKTFAAARQLTQLKSTAAHPAPNLQPATPISPPASIAPLVAPETPPPILALPQAGSTAPGPAQTAAASAPVATAWPGAVSVLPPSRRRWGLWLIAGSGLLGVVIIALGLLGFVAWQLLAAAPAVPTRLPLSATFTRLPPSATSLPPTATSSPDQLTSTQLPLISITATQLLVPSATAPATQTPVTPSQTPLTETPLLNVVSASPTPTRTRRPIVPTQTPQPTSTPVPPTSTQVPPTSTPVPPTLTPVPPTLTFTPVPPSRTPTATKPSPTPQPVSAQSTYGVSRCCGPTGAQISDQLDYSLQFNTVNQILIAFDTEPGACSDVSLHIYLDGVQVRITDFYGPVTGVTSTGWIDLGQISTGSHTLMLRPEGRATGLPGDCNSGTLGGWAGTLGVQTNHYP